jgi:hypothetical protein
MTSSYQEPSMAVKSEVAEVSDTVWWLFLSSLHLFIDLFDDCFFFF